MSIMPTRVEPLKLRQIIFTNDNEKRGGVPIRFHEGNVTLPLIEYDNDHQGVTKVKTRDMKEVIRLDHPRKEENQVEFVAYLDVHNWTRAASVPSDFCKVIYIGEKEGYDHFVCYETNEIKDPCLYRGFLNSGKY